MARPPLTLAALATAAVPGLVVQAAGPHTRHAQGDFDAVRLVAADGRQLLIRVPRSQAAESEQSADLVALRSLTPGIRSRLPFELPAFVGQAPIDGTRAIVTDFIPGAQRSADELTAESRLAESVGLAIAAIHALPTGFVADAGLSRRTAAESRDEVIALVGRAADTGRLPAALLRRWEEATDDAALWRFEPTVINGGLAAESILVDGERVTGVVGWSRLAAGDPARDLHWLLTSRGQAAERALEAYLAGRDGAADEHLPRRALMYGELELARWLLHGVDSHDETIVEDAVGLLDGLVATVHDRSSEPLAAQTGPILTVGDVERMLDGTPRGHVPREAGGALLTDSYDFSDLERFGPIEPDSPDATAPIALDLSDWGDAAPPAADTRGEAARGADAEDDVPHGERRSGTA
ncbi:phosphotransferase [Agromyces aerolatus]|uniref:phosphotransferase n=1 Tax=Agromyces sp. LY-1074 TaxID=3074080 RepID=UPI0028667E5D|nr:MULTISPECIES: phosphotransferase [unclassified Agromyces]MDR5698937.1 phosphotransferase [Agromyces sp. LY-1074]MDR5705285.1 phosphotransferase [Agromyces sp. LY-1358]